MHALLQGAARSHRHLTCAELCIPAIAATDVGEAPAKVSIEGPVSVAKAADAVMMSVAGAFPAVLEPPRCSFASDAMPVSPAAASGWLASFAILLSGDALLKSSFITPTALERV